MARMAPLAGMARRARLGIAAMTFSGMAVALGGAVLAGPAATAAQAVVTEERSVAGIDELELSGIGTLTLIQGETESLFITAEAAILPKLTSEVNAGRLTIEPQGSFSTSQPVTYELTVTDLTAIVLGGSAEIEGEEFTTERLTVELAGSSTLTLDALTADDLTLTLEGSSEAELAGEVKRQRVELSGSSTYLAAELDTREVVITAGGSSEATLRVSETLEAEVEGSATVEYHGDPTVRDDISGAGSLEPLGNDVTAASDAAGETPREPAPAAAGANPCPLDPPAPPAGIFEEPNRSADDVADLTPMEAFADQKATAYLEGFTAGAYPAVDEFDPLSPYCLGVEAFLRAQREDAAGEPPSYDGTGLDRAVDFYLGYVTGVFPDGGDDVHPFVQGVAERLRDDPIARAAAEARAVAPAAVEENAAAAGGGVYDASGDAAQTVGDVSGNDVVVQTEGAVSGNAAVEQTVGDVSGNGSVSQTVGDVS